MGDNTTKGDVLGWLDRAAEKAGSFREAAARIRNLEAENERLRDDLAWFNDQDTELRLKLNDARDQGDQLREIVREMGHDIAALTLLDAREDDPAQYVARLCRVRKYHVQLIVLLADLLEDEKGGE
jgi:chromosome segregation ATPase